MNTTMSAAQDAEFRKAAARWAAPCGAVLPALGEIMLAAAIRRRVRVMGSTCIVGLGYSPEAQVLEIRFKGGGVYRYAAIPAEKFVALQNADSVGHYYATEIKGHYFGFRVVPKAKRERSLVPALAASLALVNGAA